MLVAQFLDTSGIGIVVGGTALVTMLRSGRTELGDCVRTCGRLLAPPFTRRRATARLARVVAVIQRDGLDRGRFAPIDDQELANLLTALVQRRSLAGMAALHRAQRAARIRQREHAAATLRQAAELAPVAGLAGTLVALALPGVDDPAGGLAASVALAVLTTLYGLVLAHLVLLPLAALVERRGAADEAERLRVFDWLTRQLRGSVPAGGTEPLSGAPRTLQGHHLRHLQDTWEDAA